MQQGIDNIVEALYESETDQRWLRVTEALGSMMNANSIRVMATHHHNNEIMVDAVTPLWSRAVLKEYDRHYLHLDPRIKGGFNNIGNTVSCLDTTDLKTFEKSPIVCDFLDRPDVDARWGMLRITRSSDGFYLLFGASRPRSAGAFMPEDKERFTHALRLVERALELDTRLITLNKEKRTLEESLDAVPNATIIVTRDLHVLHLNSQAEQLIGPGKSLRVRNGRLCTARLADQKALELVVKEADEMRTGNAHPPRTAAIRSHDAPPLLARAYALAQASYVSSSGAGSTAKLDQCVLILTGGSRKIDLGVIAVLETFELTSAEQRVVQRLLEGTRLADIAAELGVAVETVRSQLKSAYAKVGVQRQSDLVRLLAQYLQ